MIGEIIVLIIALGILLWVVYLCIGEIAGAPFVMVTDELMEAILKEIDVKAGEEFWDLGSGNGKMVFAVAKKYAGKAIGVEINPLLVAFCKLKAGRGSFKNAVFLRENFFKSDITKAKWIYFYLLPGTVERLAVKIEKECSKGTMVISRAFEIKRWKHNLIKTITINNWVTFIYKV
jgi:hypothetical protein